MTLQPVGPSHVHCQPCCQQRSANHSRNPSEGWLFSHWEPEMKGTFCLPFPPGPSRAVQRGSPVSFRACAVSSEGTGASGLLSARSSAPPSDCREQIQRAWAPALAMVPAHSLAILGERKDALHSTAPSLRRANLHRSQLLWFHPKKTRAGPY